MHFKHYISLYILESSIRGRKDRKSELSSPHNNLKLSPIVNKQAHKVHIVKKLDETQKSIMVKNNGKSD